MAEGSSPEQAPRQRVLRFPADRSLGRLMSRPAKPEEPLNTFHYWSRDEDWDLLGEARGDVVVPAGHQVFLIVWRPQGWRDLSQWRIRGCRSGSCNGWTPRFS